MKMVMSGMDKPRKNLKRPQRFGSRLSVVLALLLTGLAAYIWINYLLGDVPVLAAMFATGAMMLCGLFLFLIEQLQFALAQRNQAFAWAKETQRQLSDLTKNQGARLEQQVALRAQELQKEIAELQARQQMLVVQAQHDSLTGLANRALLTDRFQFAVERAKRSAKPFAIFMIDLNDFKSVNDDHGHGAGDAVLVTMARRLVGALRASDTVARFGGDEFVLIIESIESQSEFLAISEKLFDTLSRPITLDNGVIVTTGASLGAALYPVDGLEMTELLHVADQAMYECKSSGLMNLR